MWRNMELCILLIFSITALVHIWEHTDLVVSSSQQIVNSIRYIHYSILFPKINYVWVACWRANVEWYIPSLHIYYVFITCREVHNKICIAGGDPTLVESPTEPKWTSKGVSIFIPSFYYFKFFMCSRHALSSL